MSNQDVNKEHDNLGQYIIFRFVIVLVFIYVSSIFIDWLLEGFIVPFLQNGLYLDEFRLDGNTLMGMLYLILTTFLRLLMSRMPGPMGEYISNTLIRGLGIEISPPQAVLAHGRFAVIGYGLLVFFVLLFLLIFTATPYIVGGVWFLHGVWAKVNELILMDRAKTKEYEKQRNLLLSDIAHDIKTPITAMSGYAKALSDGLVPEDKKPEYLNTIYNKSMRVGELVNMMFEYIKLDSTGYSLSLTKEDVSELTRNVAAEYYTDFEDAGIELDIDIPDEEIFFEVDKVQMSRVIANLLGNALKYLERGNKVRLSLKGVKNNMRRKESIIISVADNGLQIDDELADKIFTPFTRGDGARSTSGGNGLGLSIAAKIVELHGGKLILNRNLKDEYVKAFEMYL